MDKEYKLLKFRIIGAILFFSLVPLVTLGLFIHFQFNTTYQEKIKSNLSLIVENKKMELDMFFNERVAQLQSFANTHSYPDLSNSTRLAEMFKVMNTYTGSYIDLGIIGPDGNHVAYVGPYELGDVNYKHEVWFQKVMLKGLYISDVFMGFRQFPHFIIAIKCRQGGTTWILRATIDSEVFNTMVRNVQAGRYGDAYLVNSEGEMQSPSRFGQYGARESNLPTEGFFTGTRIITRDTGSRVMLFAMSWLKNVPWILVVAQDSSEEMNPLIRTQWTMGMILLAGVLVIMTGTWITTSHMVKRLVQSERDKSVMDAGLMQSAKLAALGKMAAGVAHEVNNPLTLIRESAGWIRDLLVEEEPEKMHNFEEIEDAVNKIDLNVERARDITHRMLGFAKRMEPTQDNVDLNHVAIQTVKFLDNEAIHRNIEIVLDLDKELPKINSDTARLQQVILNILENALDAVDSDGRIILSTAQEDGWVRMSIRDSGPGMDKKTMDKIFDPFFTTKKVGEGTGLGLSISYGIVEKLGGRLMVESEPGLGCEFIIMLPA